jgi:hypothetical protein
MKIRYRWGLGISLITMSLLGNYESRTRDITEREAQMLMGGQPGAELTRENVFNACCLNNIDCDQTEVLCSSHSTTVCINDPGSLSAFIAYATNNRSQCGDAGSSALGNCFQDWSDPKDYCGMEYTCVYDPGIGKCTQDVGTPIEVPFDCGDTCP